MIKVFLDTNFVVSCLKQKIDFLEELDRILDFSYEVFTIGQVLRELEKLGKSRLDKIADRKMGQLGLKVLEKMISEKKIKLLEVSADNADDAFLKVCEKEDILATLDGKLKNEIGCRIIVIRHGTRLELI